MRIAFISANQEKLPDPVVPLGLFYIMGSISDEFSKEFWDLCFEAEPLDYVKKKIQEVNPDVVVISMRNIQNNDYSNIETNLNYYRDLVKEIQLQTVSPIILGGSGFSVIPTQIMEFVKPTFGISGEGEYSVSLLLNTIKNKSNDFEKIPCLYYFDNGELIFTKKAEKFLDLDHYQPLKAKFGAPYYELTGTDSVQTKRGCPFKCSYCTYPQIEGRKYRLRSPSLVIDEMLVTSSNNPDLSHFFIVDSVFNHPIEYAKSICDEMIKRKQPFPWTCYVTPRELDPQLLKRMKEAGCSGVEIGSDSGNDEILEKLQKGFTAKEIKRAHDLCVECDIKDCHTFVLGTPGETLDHVKETLNFITELKPHSAILMIWHDDEDNNLPESITNDRTIHKKAILDLIKNKGKENPNWIVPAASINFNPKIFQFLRRRGVKGPLWQQL